MTLDELIDRGLALDERGLHREAAEVFAVAAEMGSPLAFFSLGNSLRALGELERAREAFRRAAIGGEVDAWLNLAIVLLELSDFEGAMQAAEKALDVGDEKAWGPLGSALWELGDEAAAERAFRESVRTRESQGMLQLAFLLDQRGDVDEAMELAQGAADLGDEMAAAVIASWRWMDTHDVTLEAALRRGAPHAETARDSLIELLRETGRAHEAESLDHPDAAPGPA